MNAFDGSLFDLPVQTSLPSSSLPVNSSTGTPSAPSLRSGFSKIFGGRSKHKEDGKEAVPEEGGTDGEKDVAKATETPPSVTPEPKMADSVSPEPKAKPPPPAIKEKPQRRSVDYSLKDDAGEEGGEEETPKRKPVGTTMPMGQLASVLKQGIGTAPLKPKVR